MISGLVDIKLASDAVANAGKDESVGDVAFRGGNSLVKPIIMSDGSVGWNHYSADVRIVAKGAIEEAEDSAIVERDGDVG